MGDRTKNKQRRISDMDSVECADHVRTSPVTLTMWRRILSVAWRWLRYDRMAGCSMAEVMIWGRGVVTAVETWV